MERRNFLRAAGAGLGTVAAAVALPAAAQGGADKPITIIVPFPPGGGTDTSTRIIAKKMTDLTGIPVLIDNKPGGNTIIGTEAVIRSAPDGSTIGLITNNLSANQSLYKGKLPYDIFKDLAPVCLTHGNAHVLLVHPSLPANTFEEFIALAKKRPGKITFVSAGSGSVNHLAGELVKSMAGIDMLHIPYKGIGTLMPDLLSGRVDALFAALPIAMDLTRDKRLRMLAVTTPKRQPEVPDMPAIAEYYPGYDFSSWFGYAATGSLPPAIVNRLNGQLLRTMKDPETARGLANFEIFGNSPAEFVEFIRNDVQKTTRLIQAAGVKLD